jgi:hypothetical protein
MGTLPQPPSSRAARAGKAEARSDVSVKIAETIREGVNPLARVIALQSDATAEEMAAGLSFST